jgi:hypothetical protein
VLNSELIVLITLEEREDVCLLLPPQNSGMSKLDEDHGMFCEKLRRKA